ncbi:tyrosyl-tRNA synthetase [Kribbella sp. VKM Ac-2527]|uniref:Tyrosine--tRNA ligase n=1 Tax=Kribbella caucasensis TaxID=2512215 RepID=A0A4R6K8T0_9ACTN|nr:tyrosine--tRNA ligase [Kribbella sp. VKM Ac-2527]TDO44857.1 tyrosyl-tRNA synthetase [Kribbella sp. VKM Ac-2527]
MTESGTVSRTQVLDDLADRGLIAHTTDPDALRAAMAAGPITSYVGFDPTAPSLHMGNLLQLLTLRRLQLAGHNPIGLVGGATGLIGDPKETSERVLNPKDVVQQWVERVRSQVERFLDFDESLPNPARMVNNYDWTKDLNTLDFLRDIGKHFPVNRMLGREVVKARLEQGISYTEFSYVLLQSLDYLELYRRHGCTLQTGGSDQWGNLTAGVELIRRTEGGKAHALATPLVTKADGTKFGKTESGTVWLDRELTTPYAFYQFWFNTDDRDVMQLVRYYTFRTADEIAVLDVATAERPHAREAQRVLAEDVTTLVHGAEETRRVQEASKALFGQGELSALDGATLVAALREAPHVELAAGEPMPAYGDLLVKSGLVASKSAARRTVAEGGGYLNNAKVSDPEYVPTADDLLPGGALVLRRGKRSFAGVLAASAAG